MVYRMMVEKSLMAEDRGLKERLQKNLRKVLPACEPHNRLNTPVCVSFVRTLSSQISRTIGM